MDFRLALAAYLLPALAVVFGAPLIFFLVPPNHFYGYRTRKTFSSPDIWYRANRIAGICMVIAGTLALLHNIHFLHEHPDMLSADQQFFLVVPTAILLLLGLFIASRFVRRL